jgi:hypothetical protein
MEYEPYARMPDKVSSMVRSYLETAEWCGLDDEQRKAFENAAAPEWTTESIERASVECNDFLSYCAGQGIQTSALDDRDLGFHFWLTHNRHGAGFWDGDYPEPLGQQLTDAAHTFGECWVMYDEATEKLALY